jgi:Mor family transcriptional regulator
MVTEEWRLQTLKKEARSFRHYQKQIEKYQERIILIEGKINNMHSPKLGGTSTPYSQHQKDALLIKNLHAKEKLILKQKPYILQRDWVIQTIESISSPAMKAIIWKTYVDGVSIKDAAEKYQMTADHLYKIRRKFLLEAMNDENIKNYYLVQESIRSLREENSKK